LLNIPVTLECLDDSSCNSHLVSSISNPTADGRSMLASMVLGAEGVQVGRCVIYMITQYM